MFINGAPCDSNPIVENFNLVFFQSEWNVSSIKSGKCWWIFLWNSEDIASLYWVSEQQMSPFYIVISDFCAVRSEPACKASVTLGNFSCNSSCNFVATERLHVVRPETWDLSRWATLLVSPRWPKTVWRTGTRTVGKFSLDDAAGRCGTSCRDDIKERLKNYLQHRETRCPKYNWFLLLATIAATKMLRGISVAGYVTLGNFSSTCVATKFPRVTNAWRHSPQPPTVHISTTPTPPSPTHRTNHNIGGLPFLFFNSVWFFNVPHFSSRTVSIDKGNWWFC